ncbi:MAG TPA: hypothetical protein PLX41_07055 [Bacteroidales bacterium]|nr:hypothetical protein [Bacteroidales bacterium]
MSKCLKCGLNVLHGIELDDSGICNYCNTIDKYSEILSKIGMQENLLRERLESIHGKGEYDCIVGLSGGKDSSYIIYRLKSHYRVRVLAFTCDNGFLTDSAIKNINSIIKDFEIDHLWVKPDRKILHKLYATNLKMDCMPCWACFHMAEATIWRLAYEYDIPFIVSGRAPEQILRRPEKEFFESLTSIILDNLDHYNQERIQAIAKSTLGRFQQEKRWLLPERFWRDAEGVLYLSEDFHISDSFSPEFLYFFLYEKHDELKIMNILESETKWRGPTKKKLLSHNDCAAHDAAAFLYQKMYGVSFVELELSAMIRHKDINHVKLGKTIETSEHSPTPFPEESFVHLGKISGMSPTHLRLLPTWIKIKNAFKNKVKRFLMTSDVGKKILELIKVIRNQ